jgi:16S rRNA G966 N2-methylase RsmD
LHRRKGGAQRGQTLEVLPLPPETALPIDSEIINTATQEEWQYDIIFLDPPYADPKIPDTLLHVTRSSLVKKGGLVVIGHSPRVVLADTYGEKTAQEKAVQLNRLRYRRHGDSAFSIYIAGEPATYGFGSQPEDDKEEVEPNIDE